MCVLLGLLGLCIGRSGEAAPPAEVLADWARQDGLAEAERVDVAAHEARRGALLARHADRIARIVFTKHYDLGGSHYAYTEGQSDAQNERHFVPGASLCLLEMEGLYGTVRTLLEDPGGVIRDPDVSWDGARVVFAHKRSLDQDDYHLYELTVADNRVRQITSGLGFADYEGAYLPNGDLVFSSTRCVQTVDCWWTEVSNLYTCRADGRAIRRLGYDQVHTNFPAVTPDGRVIYTRWEYNDRGQIFPQGLFAMHPDGTGQTALYGNNSWFPTTILHARAIPGTGKYVAIFTGHHTLQNGWLGTLDPALGREENSGAQLICPVRPTEAVRIDAYGQTGDQFQYPYPLSETEFVVAMRPEGTTRFGIYLVTAEGQRELLACDPAISCNQPIPLAPRPVPPSPSGALDLEDETGVIYLHDIYEGPGLVGVSRGTIRELRVVALEYRAAGIGSNSNHGPAGGALISTPISIQGAWDVKRVLGTAPVHEDGSACFVAPARTPLYFQALDADGFAAQTMRSWVTLQPSETVSCVGCHEDKNQAPPARNWSEAMGTGPEPLRAEAGDSGTGFSFLSQVQPVLDRHCVGCHNQPVEPPSRIYDPDVMRESVQSAGALWRYTLSPPSDDWTQPGFDDSAWQTGPGGFGIRGTPGAVIGTEWTTSDIWLRRTVTLGEKDLAGAPIWLAHHDEDLEVYVNGVYAGGAPGFLTGYELLPMTLAGRRALHAGANTLAAHCRQTLGGQYVDVGLVDAGTGPAIADAAFSLRADAVFDPQSLRHWPRSYLNLANRRFVNWVNAQSEPPVQPPYRAGAARSPLIDLLRSGHADIRLTPEELHRIAMWIDLCVPCFGDYRDTLDGDNLARYEHFLAKRRGWEAQERAGLLSLGQAGP
jgi:hypothetical protein